MSRDDERKLIAAKRAYRDASQEGNWNEEARWANVIGDILKNRGEYVESLKWLRIDYEVSIKHLPEKQLLTTCQSLGEVYLRLEYFRDALIYQKKHLELAKDSKDLIEQQRANTQLGRTYHEMFLKSNDDHYSVRNAKKYFKASMKLAQTLKKNPPSNETSFLNEFIDAHNNIGMLEMDLDNLEEAEKVLVKGLEICDEEEVVEDNDVRTRLHHNLGNVYMELRIWDEAQEHIEKDIIICKKIGHCQGEAKGYINLGELHYRVQKYEEAILCYKKALDLAKSMEDEDALASQIENNIQTVNEAVEVVDELKKEEQNLKKLSRSMVMARGTPNERRCILQQNGSLDRLIEKSSMISAWLKHLEFAKRKKKIADELCDKEKLGDSFLLIGDSYQKLRNFDKALKWYGKAWVTYKSIGNLEGQALVKINIGDALDSDGNWTGALDAFEDGYKIAVKANLTSVQVSALENMHYSHMIRFDNIERARSLQCLIDNLKQSKGGVLDVNTKSDDRCSETDSEGDDCLSTSKSNARSSALKSRPMHSRSKPLVDPCPKDDDLPLVSFLKSTEPSRPFKQHYIHNNVQSMPIKTSLELLPDSNRDGQPGERLPKRVLLVLSDEESEMLGETKGSKKQKICEHSVEGIATSGRSRDECATQPHQIDEFLDIPEVSNSCPLSTHNPVNLEDNRCSQKSDFSNVAAQKPNIFKSASTSENLHHSNASASYFDSTENLLQRHSDPGIDFPSLSDDNYHTVTFKIDNELIPMKIGSCVIDGELNIECLKVEVACLYYLQLNLKKRRQDEHGLSGLLPIIQLMTCGCCVLESLGNFKTLKDQVGDGWVEVFVDGWIQKPLMKLYIDCCEDLSEVPNLMLLKKLYNLEVSEDEVIASECELQDISIAPLLNALNAHMSISMIDLSHNFLGNGTIEKLKQVLTSSCQKYGGLSLDLHCNRFGPTALFQICECPVLFVRLEALNISGNRLTDACGSYLASILKHCKALYSLNVERCSLTSRTIQTIADSLDPGCLLAQLSLGYNHPISANALMNILAKLSTLERLSELNISGIKLSKLVIDSLCKYLKSSCLSVLMLGETGVGTAGALQLSESLFSAQQSLEKLNLAYCGLTLPYVVKLSSDFPLACAITHLNLEGNSIKQEGAGAVASLLENPQCCIKVLVLNNCDLGLEGVLQVMQALAGNSSLEELHLVGNASPEALCGINMKDLEVADSEDEQVMTHHGIGDQEHGLIERLSSGIDNAKTLALLDLSKNGFSSAIAETLYKAWSSNPRGGGRASQKHIKGDVLHLSIQSVRCCKPRPCCRRDWY